MVVVFCFPSFCLVLCKNDTISVLLEPVRDCLDQQVNRFVKTWALRCFHTKSKAKLSRGAITIECKYAYRRKSLGGSSHLAVRITQKLREDEIFAKFEDFDRVATVVGSVMAGGMKR